MASHDRPTTYKISETFYSIQGEGRWVGTPMFFARLSQCPVGGSKGICTGWDGTRFICDTGPSYKHKGAEPTEWHSYTEVNKTMDAEDIWKECQSHECQHLCLTGGEPLVYDLMPLIRTAPYDSLIHIETSGTEDQSSLIKKHSNQCWLTVSPKEGCLKEMIRIASEVKFLVHHETDAKQLLRYISDMEIIPWGSFQRHLLYLQPIEDVSTEQWNANVHRAIELALTIPNWFKVSFQTHKQANIR